MGFCEDLSKLIKHMEGLIIITIFKWDNSICLVKLLRIMCLVHCKSLMSGSSYNPVFGCFLFVCLFVCFFREQNAFYPQRNLYSQVR